MNLDRLDFPHEKENNMSKEGRHDPLLGYEEWGRLTLCDNSFGSSQQSPLPPDFNGEVVSESDQPNPITTSEWSSMFYNQALDHSIKIIEAFKGRDDVFAPILNEIIKTISQLKK